MSPQQRQGVGQVHCARDHAVDEPMFETDGRRPLQDGDAPLEVPAKHVDVAEHRLGERGARQVLDLGGHADRVARRAQRDVETSERGKRFRLANTSGHVDRKHGPAVGDERDLIGEQRRGGIEDRSESSTGRALDSPPLQSAQNCGS